MDRVTAVVPAHEKDWDTLQETIISLAKQVHNLGDIFVVSALSPPPRVLGPARWLPEADFPFCLADLQPTPLTSAPSTSRGWVYQQLLKLHAPLLLQSLGLVPAERIHFAVVDADTVWVRPVELLSPDGHPYLSTFRIEDAPEIRSRADLHRYDDFVEAALPGLRKRSRCVETAVVHHSVFSVPILRDLHLRVEQHHGKPLWQVFRDLSLSLDGRVSEYELYFAFAWAFHRKAVVHRPLPFAIVSDWQAYVATMGSPPPVAYIVSHSHLRQAAASLTQEQLAEREGIINASVEHDRPFQSLEAQPGHGAVPGDEAPFQQRESPKGNGGKAQGRPRPAPSPPTDPAASLLAILSRNGVFDLQSG